MSAYGKKTNSKSVAPPGRGSVYIPAANGLQKIFGTFSSETLEALSELISSDTIVGYGTGPSAEDRSELLINALGFSIVKKNDLSPGLSSLKQFSLIGSTNVDETIQNSKIIDPDLSKLTPVFETIDDKFKSESDSIYDIDQERNDNIKKAVLLENGMENKSSIVIAKHLANKSRKSNNKMLNQVTQRGRKTT